uniref:HMA domain-containing protein n=1 Tax=Cannabis sativa TaxID=3483 RepID=A0A803QIG0_CANSA
MKLNVVIKVALDDKKSRTKAIKTAVGIDGVTQATLQNEKNQIEVTGEDIDVVLLTTLLRKSLKYAEVVSYSAVFHSTPADSDDAKSTNQVMAALIASPKLHLLNPSSNQPENNIAAAPTIATQVLLQQF